MVERRLAKANVASSNLVFRSQKTQTIIVCVFFCYQEDKRMLSWKQKTFGIVEMLFAG